MPIVPRHMAWQWHMAHGTCRGCSHWVYTHWHYQEAEAGRLGQEVRSAGMELGAMDYELPVEHSAFRNQEAHEVTCSCAPQGG
jgi:hypothetical protein